jgi:hypothetical protein
MTTCSSEADHCSPGGGIDHVGDLDVIARGQAWERARALGESRMLPDLEIEVVAIGSSITVGTRWAIGQFSSGELIETAETISGIPCARLEHVIAYKRLANRPKDRDHLAVIARRLNSGPETPSPGFTA